MIIAINPKTISKEEIQKYEEKKYRRIETLVRVGRYLDTYYNQIDLKLCTNVYLLPIEANIACEHKGFDDAVISEGINPTRDDDTFLNYIASFACFKAIVFMDEDGYSKYSKYTLEDLSDIPLIGTITGEIDLSSKICETIPNIATWHLYQMKNDDIDLFACVANNLNLDIIFATNILENKSDLKIKTGGTNVSISTKGDVWNIHTTNNTIDAIWTKIEISKFTPVEKKTGISFRELVETKKTSKYQSTVMDDILEIDEIDI